ncbi:type III effector HrpK domain-containing protein [Pseudomonas syringae]|uniref:type III effector HrpK domain-containing protein n=1 Tax=Pseudomonas syringae TaxID=317 RepID=UPI0007360AAA|nr:type III effector HrpK domain-containing protein [Pseudomonas syringae]KTB81749.1 type III effector HrpK [Pseudomonas syringae pv. syringae PD2766]
MTTVNKITTEKPTNPADAKAWEQAVQQSREVGIQWQLPDDDKRSAQQIIDDSPLLKNLGGRGDKGEAKENLIAQVGDYTKDSNAAFRAVQLLEHIETFDANGDRLAGKDIGNNRIDGYTSSSDARHGTEAGRLKDFGKDGFSSLKGKLHETRSAANDPATREQAEKLGIHWERPAGDERDARSIVEGDPLLRNLGNQSDVRDMLKEQVGDFDNDADAAYRATQVLAHIEQFDGNGARIVGGDVANGSINGFTKSGEARNGTEAGRLQDFGTDGFSSLKGEMANVSVAGDNTQTREQAEKLGFMWELPKDDQRSAQDIIDANPLLKNLGNQSGVKDMLKERVGDFEKDANAAFRAAQVLDRVTMYNEKGEIQSGGDVFNSRVDGFTKGAEARHGTEAGRLQDFGKLGFDALPELKKSEDISSYKDFLKANPDADDASKQIARYAAILDENHDAIKGKTGSKDMNAEALAAYKDKNPQLDKEVKEALDFWSQPGAFALLDNAKSPLEQGADGKASRADIQAFIKTASPKDVGAVGTLLEVVAEGNLLNKVNTDALNKDVFDNPQNYTAEQKAAVLQELKAAQSLIVKGSGAGMWKDDKSQVQIANNVRSHPDAQKLLDDVNEHIATLEKDPAVVKFYNENATSELSKVLEGSEGLKNALQSTYDNDIKTGKALDTLWDANTKDGKTDQQTALAQFYSSAQSVQESLGVSNPSEIQAAVQKSTHNKDFESFYEKSLVSGERLKELLKTESFEVATSQFSMEVAMYNAALNPEFTNKFDDAATKNYTDIAQDNVFKDASFDDLKTAFGVDGGDTLDEAKVRSLIDQVAESNPELLMNADGKPATSDQILGVFRGNWDLLRQGTKSISELGLFSKDSSIKAASNAGVLHGVSGLFMAGITIAKGASGAGALTDRQVVDITTGSVQSATLLVEGGVKHFTDKFKAVKDTANPSAYAYITSNLSKLENAAKGLGGLAGVAAGAYGIFDGVKSIRKGELVAGGMSITAGSLGAMAGLASAAEGAAGVFQLTGSVVRALPLLAGSLGIAAAGIGALAMLIPGLIEEGKQETRVDRFSDHLRDYLTQYEIDGVKDGTIMDIPDSEWPGPEETTIAS